MYSKSSHDSDLKIFLSIFSSVIPES